MAKKRPYMKNSVLIAIAFLQLSSYALADADQSKKTVTASGVASAAATIYSIKKLKYAEEIEAKNTKVILDFPQNPQVIDESLVNRAATQASEGDVVTLRYQLSEAESRERFVQIADKKIAELQLQADELAQENKMEASILKAQEATKLREEVAAVQAGKSVDPIVEVARIDTKKISLREFLASRAEKGSKLLNLSSVPRKLSIEFSKLRGKVGVAVAATGVASVAGIFVYSLFGVESVEVTDQVTIEESDLERPAQYVRPNAISQ